MQRTDPGEIFSSNANIIFLGNTLLERERLYSYLETHIYQALPDRNLTFRNLAWAADEAGLMARPEGFGTLDESLVKYQADVIIAAFGFNESFKGPAQLDEFKADLKKLVGNLRGKAYNGHTPPQILLISPIPNEDNQQVKAAELNNANLRIYSKAIQVVAKEEDIFYLEVYDSMLEEMKNADVPLTGNGVHLNEIGYRKFSAHIFERLFGRQPPEINNNIRKVAIEKNEFFFRRHRPINSFYYVGDRDSRREIDFDPVMLQLDGLLKNRDQKLWSLAQGESNDTQIDDSNVHPLGAYTGEREANRWLTVADELKEFYIDPRFEVTCFASEEDFPDLACPIQIRWDSKGRLWVSTSTTYPHARASTVPEDKIIILEDTDQDGKADKSSVFAEGLNIPLSFELGNGGVYVSEQPYLTFLKDTDGDDKADTKEILFSSFGTEDSHHSLHDFTWTPDGDLIFRESIFHYSQVETPYGPVRTKNGAWFRYTPRTGKLTAFGSYYSTNPWGLTFDNWGQHMGSHPIYATAFHALNPPYPQQHKRAFGLKAYSGTAGMEFIYNPHYPEDLQGFFIKNRYKPTNNIELHRWIDKGSYFQEEKVSDLIFSKNLSFYSGRYSNGPRRRYLHL